MFPSLDRLYDSSMAQSVLNRRPRYSFATVLEQLSRGEAIGSDLARTVGSKGYHERAFDDGPYPVEA